MSRLSKEQKQKLDVIIENENFFKKVNDLLKEHGAGELQLTSLKVQPKHGGREKNGSLTVFETSTSAALTRGIPNFDTFPPTCEHGKPMKERCTVGGSCRWVCNHP
jgi:hypothetical protein